MKTKPLEAVSEAGEGILVLLYTLLLTMLFGLGAGCADQTTPTIYTKTLPGTRAATAGRHGQLDWSTTL